MAEPIGLAIGVAGLAGLFSTCVECMDYISLGRDYGKDYELSLTKTILLKARLNAWGESLCVMQEGRELAVLRDYWSQEKDAVGRCLLGIKTIFDDTTQIETKYGLEPFNTDRHSLSHLQGQRSGAFRQIEDKFKSRIQGRQEDASMWKKTCWAIRDKKKFDSLIADLAFYVDGLEKLSDRLQVLGLQRRLLEVEIRAITDTNTLRMLEDASAQTRTASLSRESTDKDSGARGNTSGHTYIRTIIKDRAKVLNGNLGLQGQSSHFYDGTQTYDDAHVVQGNMSAEAALAFFK